MKKRRLLHALPSPLLAACLWMGTPAGLAQVDTALVEQMRGLVDQGRYQDAYVLAQDGLFDNEGDPDFDFLYGLSALESGRPDEAVFALERVAYAYPQDRRVKLELARAYYMGNNLPAARRLFTEVLETGPEPNVAANIGNFLDAIDQRSEATRSTLRWFANANIGSDSNINSATELGVISTPIGDVELNPEGRSIDDEFMDLGGGFTFQHPLDKNRALSFSGSLNQHNNLGTDAFDLDTLVLEGAYGEVRDDQRYTGGLRYQRVLLDGDDFQQSTSLLGTWQRSLGGGWGQAVTAAWSMIRYDDSSARPDNSLRDVNQLLLSGVLSKLSGRFHHSLSLYWGDDDSLHSEGRHNAQRFWGIAFGQQYQFSRDHLPYARLSLHRSEHERAAPVFGKVREDDTLSATVGWQWRFNRQMNINTELTWTDNDSSIELYGYDRLKLQTGFRYQF